MNDDTGMITVEVAYALPARQRIVELQVPVGTQALEAVRRSGIQQLFPEIDLEQVELGIFSQVLGTKGLPPASEYQLRHRDRVEIYRPLIADPKEARRKRAEKKGVAD